MKKALLLFLGFLIGMIIFMPKEELYYKVLHILHQNKIDVISKTSSSLFSLNLKNIRVNYLGIKAAEIKKTEILPLVFYNKAEAKDIKLKIGNFFIKKVSIIYIPFTDAKIKGKGNFGEFSGFLNLKEIKIYIKNPSAEIKGFLSKDKKGYYYHESF